MRRSMNEPALARAQQIWAALDVAVASNKRHGVVSPFLTEHAYRKGRGLAVPNQLGRLAIEMHDAGYSADAIEAAVVGVVRGILSIDLAFARVERHEPVFPALPLVERRAGGGSAPKQQPRTRSNASGSGPPHQRQEHSLMDTGTIAHDDVPNNAGPLADMLRVMVAKYAWLAQRNNRDLPPVDRSMHEWWMR